MLKHRIIPVLFLKHGWLVRSEAFHIHQILGNPLAQVERYNTWDVDELIYIDITPDERYDIQRDDLGGEGTCNPQSFLDIIRLVSSKCFMPLCVGGKIRTVEDARRRFEAGADKITINSQALADPGFITACAHEFGSQAVVVSVDALRHPDGRFEVYSERGAAPTGLSPEAWCQVAEARGAGEILLNAIHRDGTATGYDLDLIRTVTAATSIPIIALGGVGSSEDFGQAIVEGGAQAAAAGNIFHFKELSYPLTKRHLRKLAINVR